MLKSLSLDSSGGAKGQNLISTLNRMVTEKSDSQFAGLVNSWTGRFVKSRNAVFKIAYTVSEYFHFPI